MICYLSKWIKNRVGVFLWFLVPFWLTYSPICSDLNENLDQEGFEPQFIKEIDGEMVELEGGKKQAMAKRVISMKNREI